jgi:hypothetical protein
MINRRSFVHLFLAAASTVWLHPSAASALAPTHRPLVLLLGPTSRGQAFAEGFVDALAARAVWRAGPLASPQSDLDVLTCDLRQLHGSRLIYMGDDRDQLLVQLALSGLDARLLYSGHHRDVTGTSLHSLQPTSRTWSCAAGLSDDLGTAGHAFVVRDSLMSSEIRGSGRGVAVTPWPTVLGRRLASLASGLPIQVQPIGGGAHRSRTSAAVATLIADL